MIVMQIVRVIVMKVYQVQKIRSQREILKVIGIKKKIDDRVKDNTIIINEGFLKTPFGKHFGYGHGPSGSIFNVSLPCPVQ